jgi:O-antigen biosynthesis alpha-1,3-rhamnosyltransferase
MRIAFNATSLLSPFAGLAQYTFELATRLVAAPGVDVHFFYGYGWDKAVRSTPLPGAGTWLPRARQFVPFSYQVARFLKNRQFRRGMRAHRFDVYHEPAFLPLDFDGPIVTTVHDLSWIRFPQAHPAERVKAMERYFEPGLRKASLVLTDSSFVRQEVIETFGMAPERVVAIPLGVSPLFRPQSEQETRPLLARRGLAHGQYLLSVGTLEPRKNLATVLRAYAALPPATQEKIPLVLAGLPGWNFGALATEIAPLVAAGKVRAVGYLSRPDLAALIAGAATLIYPSLYEGFGLPPLEAMACGVPPIVSNASSLPELVGDAGMQVEPLDVAALRDAMQSLLDQPGLRSELGRRALMQAQRFSWDSCARHTLAAYRLAANADT